MEPVTISHGLLNHNIRRLPIAMRILGYMNHSTPAHHPTGGALGRALDPVFNMPANLPKDVVLIYTLGSSVVAWAPRLPPGQIDLWVHYNQVHVRLVRI